ncbi:tRNA-binding protein [Paracoccus albus]|uniref:tRNA-binding protein n=1 Tax=Paracoccus albus TaxID=3017784 RepID=UPI0022F02C10|nr:tRNA-binding protein [Paracoccus albus]WBU61516.1 tRNA-binding protein [Paracoccus albus]
MKKDQIVYDDFAKIEMRLGKIINVQEFPRARNPSYKVEVDFGELGTRWSSAQITNYSIEDLIGRAVICTVNMPPRNIAGFQSEVLIMGVPNAEGQVILLQPEADAVLGAEVY